MGSRTDEAQREVDAQRALIERKLDALELRVADDFSAARSQVADRVGQLPAMVPGGATLLNGAKEHPFSTMAGALGAGVALGLLSDRFGGEDDDEPEASRGRRRRGRADDDELGIARRALGTVATSLLAPLQAQVSDLAREVVAGFAARAQSDDRAVGR